MSVSPRLLQSPAVDSSGRYRAPQYEPVAGEVWHHVLYGHVPKYQMDFILRPVVPYHCLRPQHLAHLSALIKFLAPSGDETYAFAIGNLSCDDTQHLPGRGGLALLMGTRIPGLRDHALRDSPVFAHGLLCVDQRLEPQLLHAVAVRFKEGVLADGLNWYSSYYRVGQPDQPERTLSYVRSFAELPVPESTEAPPVWFQDAPPPYNLIHIDCGTAAFEEIVWYAARLASILYRTSLRWTSISTGSEPVLRKTFGGDEYGVAVRFLRTNHQSQAGAYDDPSADSGAPLRLLHIALADLDYSDESLALRLFGLPPANLSRGTLPTPEQAVQAVLPTTEDLWITSPRYSATAEAAELPPFASADPLTSPAPVETPLPGSPTARDRAPPKLIPRSSAALALGSGFLGMALGALAFWLLVDTPGAERLHGALRADAAVAAPDAQRDTPDNLPPPLQDPSAAALRVDADADSSRSRPKSPPDTRFPEDLVRLLSFQAEQSQQELDRLKRQLLDGGTKANSVTQNERLYADVNQAAEQLKSLRRVLAQREAIPENQLAERIFGPLCEANISLHSARRRAGLDSGGTAKSLAAAHPSSHAAPSHRRSGGAAE